MEVFRDGNIILVDQEGVIIQPLTHASYAGRTLKKGVEYAPPPPAMDPYQLDEAALQALLNDSDRTSFPPSAGRSIWAPPTPMRSAPLRSTSPILRHKKPMQPSFTQPFRRCYLNLMTATRAISFSNCERMMTTPWSPVYEGLTAGEQHVWLAERSVGSDADSSPNTPICPK